MEATVILATCNTTKKKFGIRAEKMQNMWVFTWSFKLSDKAAKNEGFDKTSVSGAIGISEEYPGCPHCEAMSFYQCGNCNNIICYNNEDMKVTCPVCGAQGELTVGESFDEITGNEF